MPRHLLLTYDFPPMGGGIARWMAELARRYPPGSLIVSTGQYPGSQDADQSLPNRVDRVGVRARRLRTVPGLLQWSRRVAALARAHQADFIWCGNIKPAAYPAKWTRERLGTPFGILLHGGDLLVLQHQIHQSALKRRTARALLGSASVLAANSNYTRELCYAVLHELGIPTTPQSVRLVPLGADPEFFRPGIDPSPVRQRYRLPEARWLVTVARLMRHKGIDTVIRALAELRDVAPDLRYAVAGSGERLAELQTLARELGVGERVHFLGRVPDADLPALFNLAEIYLGVARRAENGVEGFGIAITEASACGRPVIAGRAGGMPDAVRDGETGILVNSEEPAEVAAAIRRLLDDRELAERLGQGGRRAVETYYNWDRVTRDLIAIADQAATSPSSAATAAR